MKQRSIHPLYEIWRGMRQRCSNPKATKYQYYGGRGIRVCKRWRDSFENFVADMGERPPGTSLDRIDGHRDYGPANCRWATRKEQRENYRPEGQSAIRWVTFNGVRKGLAEWARQLGLHVTTLESRLEKGWPLEQVLSSEKHWPLKRKIDPVFGPNEQEVGKPYCKHGHDLSNGNQGRNNRGSRICLACGRVQRRISYHTERSLS